MIHKLKRRQILMRRLFLKLNLHHQLGDEKNQRLKSLNLNPKLQKLQGTSGVRMKKPL
jgi:hypothetical protein